MQSEPGPSCLRRGSQGLMSSRQQGCHNKSLKPGLARGCTSAATKRGQLHPVSEPEARSLGLTRCAVPHSGPSRAAVPPWWHWG